MSDTRERAEELREHTAHQLELSALKIDDQRITGTLQGFPVSLEGEAPFHAFVVDLGSALPMAKLVLQPGDLNHPDAVETGDPDFDEAMQVLAQPGLAPTALKLLSDAQTRRALLELLRRHPDSVLSGRSLTVRSREPITRALVVEAVEVARRLTAKFAEVGFLETEERPKLPPNELTAKEAVEVRANIVAVSAIALGLFWAGAWVFDMPLSIKGPVLVGGAFLAALRVWDVGRRAEKEKRK